MEHGIYHKLRLSLYIENTERWLEDYQYTLSGVDYSIWSELNEHDKSYYMWSSRHLNTVTDYTDLCNKAKALQMIHKGACLIYRDASIMNTYCANLKITPEVCFHERHDPLNTHGFISFENINIIENPFCNKVLESKIPVNRDPLRNLVDKVIFLARYDKTIRNILLYTGYNGLSYITLYAYKDWMKSNGIDDKQIASWADWSNAKLKDFHNTANNPAYLGPFCRHGGVTELPKRPMPLKEAQKGMILALRHFIRYKCSQIKLCKLLKELQEQ